MPQIATINEKTNRTGIQETGDIVGVFEDKHVFSDTEKTNYDIHQVSGYSVKELQLALYQRRVEIKQMWKDTDGTWKELKESPKFKQSLKNFTSTDLSSLENPASTLAERNTILDNLCDRTKELTINQSIVNALITAKAL